MSGAGSILEEKGWRQGTFVKDEDLPLLMSSLSSEKHEDGLVAVVASQSCDIACDNLSLAPDIELSVGKRITNAEVESNYTFNKNPRILHTSYRLRTGDDLTGHEQNIELRACEKISLPKEHFLSFDPDEEKVIPIEKLGSYVAWLAARYSRPAHPTTFNNRIKSVDPKDKLKKHAKSCDRSLLSGIYVKITPDKEVDEDETYNVNLLGAVLSNVVNLKPAEESLGKVASVLTAAGFDVKAVVLHESKVSLALIKDYKRFYYDDISFRNSSPHPVETTTTLS